MYVGLYIELTGFKHNVDSSRTKTERTEGGLGQLGIPLLSDLSHSISKDYGVYLEDLGHTLR